MAKKQGAKKRRAKSNRVKVLDKKIVKTEWRDKLASCAHLIIIVAKINDEFVTGDEPGYFKLWVNLESGGWSVTNRIRLDVIGKVQKLYGERSELAIITYVSRGITKVSLPGYLDSLVYRDILYDIEVKVKRVT